MRSASKLKQALFGHLPTVRRVFLLCFVFPLITGCKFYEIKLQTSELKKEAFLLEEKIRGMGLEQQMNINEANDVKINSFLLQNLKNELEQSQKNFMK